MDNSNNTSSAIARGSGLYIAAGWVCAVISLFFYPFIFGVLGVVLGILATKRGSRAGITLIGASILCIAVGLIFGATLSNYALHYLGRRR